MTSYTTTATIGVGVKPSGVTVLGHTGQFYLTQKTIRVGIKGSGTTHMSGGTNASIGVGVRPAGVTAASMHTPGTARVGLRPSGSSGHGTNTTATIKVGVRPSGISFLRGRTHGSIGVGIKPVPVTALHGATHGTAKVGVKPEGESAAGFSTSRTVGVGVKPKGTSAASQHTTATIKAGIKPVGVTALMGRTPGTIKAAVKPSGNSSWGHNTQASISAAVRPSGISVSGSTAANFVTNATIRVRLKPWGTTTGSQYTSVQTFDNLVAAIRAVSKATLTEISTSSNRFPETINEAQDLAQEGTFPFLAIIVGAGVDISQEFAVFDVGQRVPVDLVYCVVTKRTGTNDSAQDLRARLGVLQSAFMADRRLGGVATTTTVKNVPEEKANQYEVQITGTGQALTCMVLSLEFTIVQSVLPPGVQ